jgi:hypothetical protein
VVILFSFALFGFTTDYISMANLRNFGLHGCLSVWGRGILVDRRKSCTASFGTAETGKVDFKQSDRCPMVRRILIIVEPFLPGN